MSSARTDLSAAALTDWRALLDAVSRHPFPEVWWLAQERCCLVIGADGDAIPASQNELASLGRWLRGLPCPVVALAPDSAWHDALPACDVRTARREDAALIARNCARSPLAALALVHVLRIAENLPPEQALLAESLAYATLQAGPEFARWRHGYTRSGAIADEGPAVRIDRSGSEVTIRLNRPHARNALNIAMRDALVEAFELVSSDPTIMATVSGMGRCYSVGGDLREFGDRPDAPSAHRIRSLRSPALALMRCAERVDFRVHSACIGSGMELAAFGRKIHARSDAYFQLPELHFGLIPGSGGCVSLPRRIGRQRTALLALTGRRLGAREALAWGLVNELFE
jgi:enoyl-CoA hydratase/carnithine racemase